MINLIPSHLEHKYGERIIGVFTQDGNTYYLIHSTQKREGIDYLELNNQTIKYRCKRCFEQTDSHTYEGFAFIVDELDNRHSPADLIIDFNMVFTANYCETCEKRIMSKVSASVVCKVCGRTISYLEPGDKVRVGDIFYVTCQMCKGGVVNATPA